MSHLLFEWLNDELKLSRPVYDFDSAFRNGFLIGEILHKYNQLVEYHHLVDKPSAVDSLANFQLLEPVMRKLGVHFNSQVAAEIMRGDPKATKSLLYELKVCLDAVVRNSRISLADSLRGTRNDKPITVIPSSRPAYQRTVSQTFQSAVRLKLENTNALMMDKATQHYTDRIHNYQRTISIGEETDLMMLRDSRTRAKELHRSRKAREGEVAANWEAMNIAQWRKNQRTAHQRKALKERVLDGLATQRTMRMEKNKDEDKHYAYESMKEFDEKLERLILPSGEEAERSKAIEAQFIKTITIP